jgi:5-methylcytosine-specific restriction endonuclease McrA
MIRVQRADEPETFDALVRRPGLRALARRTGEDVPGPGRPPKNVYDRREDIPSKEFPPEWRTAIPDLLDRYSHLCAYTALYIEDGTGDATVDHFVPISTDWRLAYEWSNFRLSCGQVNANKDLAQPLDPFEIEDGWFELDLVGYQVIPGACTTDPLRTLIRATIESVLKLNSACFRRQRSKYAEAYLTGQISLEYLERRAPFVARELRRQGKLRPRTA